LYSSEQNTNEAMAVKQVYQKEDKKYTIKPAQFLNKSPYTHNINA
jgi:hypothetical protein